MNRMVRTWQAHEVRSGYSGPDAVVIDGIKYQFSEEDKMPIQLKMPDNHFRNVIRAIRTANLDRIKPLEGVVKEAMKRLSQKRSMKMAWKKTPEGSDQLDIGSLIAWVNKIQPANKPAIAQLVSIDATLARRLKG